MTVAEKQVARVLSKGSLKHDPLVTTGADVVGAMAFTSRLGSLLWRIKWGGDRRSIEPATLLLARLLRRPGEAFGMIRQLAAVAMREYIDNRCTHCGGRGHVTNVDRVVSSCTHCHGTGVAQISDQSRIRALGCNEHAYNQKWQKRLSEAHSRLSENDNTAGYDIRQQLKEQ